VLLNALVTIQDEQVTPQADRPKRQPLTGTVSIEWVDAADPDDVDADPNIGWFGVKSEPPLDLRRMIALLRAVTASAEEDLRDGSEQGS
jgi:hypothetical protein